MSAYVWKQGDTLMASVIEGLGTKNLVADEMFGLVKKDYYENIAYDTVATIVNDLVSVGARPISLHAFWGIGDLAWLKNRKRIENLISGWKKACDDSMASWGGGESPTARGLIEKNAIVLGGSCVGIIGSESRLISDKALKAGDRIILIKSNGPNANAIFLIRAVSKKLPRGYLTKLPGGKIFGEQVLNKSNIYAKLLKDILDSGIKISYASNITGHGMRKIMRANRDFTYIIEEVFEPQGLYFLIQKETNLSDHEMYATFNMGQDYALFIRPKDVKRTLEIIKTNKFKGLDAGVVKRGERKVVIEPKDIEYKSSELDLG